MILVTIGTNEQPFDRLIRAVEQLEVHEQMVVQHGSCQIAEPRRDWFDFLSFEELTELMREARVVVAHAGIGSIMVARRCGKRPIVVPRRLQHAEAVDDHQLPMARRLHENGLVDLVEDERLLGNHLAGGRRERRVAPTDAELPDGLALAIDLRGYLESVVGAAVCPGPKTASPILNDLPGSEPRTPRSVTP